MQRARMYQHPTQDGSRTITIHDSAPREAHPADPSNHESPNEDAGDHNRDERDDGGAPRLVLNLQGGGAVRKTKKAGQRVVWKEDVVDNEGCGKKKSKICCIYHKPKKYDESSDESDSSDCEGRSGHNHHNHASGEGSSSNGNNGTSGTAAIASSTVTVTTVKSPERNAYEAPPHQHHKSP